AQRLEALGITTARGRFGAHMHVALENDGPVTIIIDTADLDRPRRG
ncbi:MAG: D-aminoacyl-tRNA deacylase, partial [Dehalococcoidia bacterium]